MKQTIKMIRLVATNIAKNASKIAFIGLVSAGAYTVASASEINDVKKAAPITEKARLTAVTMDFTSVEAMVLAGTAKKVNAEFATKQAKDSAKKTELMKESVLGEASARHEDRFIPKVVVYTMENRVSRPLLYTAFRYKGNDMLIGSLTNPSNWEPATGTESCELGELPCVVTTDTEFSDGEDFAQYLDDLAPATAISYVNTHTSQHRDPD